MVGTAITQSGARAWVCNADGQGTVQDLGVLAGVPNSTCDALNSANAISDKKLVAGLAAAGVD